MATKRHQDLLTIFERDKIITTANAPSSPLYRQGAKAGPHVVVSGIAGIDPSSGSLAETRSKIRHDRR